MARGVNKVILVGNVGQEPQTRNTATTTVTEISVATSETWKDASGQKQERTEWHRVTMFGKLAEIAAQYLTKGAQVYIEGSIRTDKYQDKQTGADRYTTKIIANEMQMLGGRGSDAKPSAPRPEPRQHSPEPPPLDIDDEIPF